MPDGRPTNDEIADVLNQIADLLEADEANRFKVEAYREGASTVRSLDESVADIVREGGEEALEGLPNVGEGISRVIAGYTCGGDVRTCWSD